MAVNGIHAETVNGSTVEDERPQISPYTNPATILIGHKSVCYTVPKHFVSQYPAWADKSIVNLSDVDDDIGHTLVHFLYTGTYQTLKPSSVSNGDVSGDILEYKRSLKVYSVAKTYGLGELEHYAREKIQRYGSEMSITDVLAVAEDSDFESGEEDEGQTWSMKYLQEKLMAEYAKDEDIFVSEGFLKSLGNRPVVTRLIIKLMDGIYKEKIAQAKEQVNHIPKESNSIEVEVQTNSNQDDSKVHELELEVPKDSIKEVAADLATETTSNSMNGAEEDAILTKKKKKSSKKKKNKGEEQSPVDPEHLQDSKPELGRRFEWT